MPSVISVLIEFQTVVVRGRSVRRPWWGFLQSGLLGESRCYTTLEKIFWWLRLIVLYAHIANAP